MQWLLMFALMGFSIKKGQRELIITGFTQVYFSFVDRDDNTFGIKRHRLIFKLKERKNLCFKLQMEFLRSPALLDVKMRYRFGKFLLQLGRFLPDFSFYMPRSSLNLDFVNYPWIASKFGMWRQVGMEFSYYPLKQMVVRAGVYNGPKNNFRDSDGMKDVLVKLGYRFTRNFTSGLYGYNMKVPGFTRNMGGFYIDLRKQILFTSEVLFVKDTINSICLYIQPGLRIGKNHKVLVRYERLKQGDSNEEQISASYVYAFADHFKFYLNYVKPFDEKGEAILMLQCRW